MLKRIFFLLTLFTIFSTFIPPITANAAVCKGVLVSEEVYGEGGTMEDQKEGKGLVDKFLIDQTRNLANVGELNSLSGVVYGNPYCVWAENEVMAEDGVFTTTEKNKIIDPVFKVLGAVYGTIITLAIMISALKLSFKAHSPQSRADFWQDVMYWVLSALFLATFTQTTNLLFSLNQAIVDTFGALAGERVENTSIIAGFGEDWAIGWIFTFLAEWFLALIMNFIYIARKIVILLLMIMGVVAAVSLVFAKTRYFFGVWLKELIGNIFLQSIHAIILFAFAMMAETGASIILKLGMMIMFIPLSGMVSKWLNLGDSSSKLGNTLTMAGMAGIGGALHLTKRTSDVLRGKGQGQGRKGPTGSTNETQSEAGGGSDIAPSTISTDISGANSQKFQTFKEIAGIGGAAVLGTAGLVAGPAGMAIMGKAGDMGAQGLVQGGRNVTGSVGKLKKITKDSKDYGSTHQDGFKGNWSNLERRREVMGDTGEALGSLFSLGGTKSGTIGKKIGKAVSGVSQKRIMTTPQHEGGTATALGVPVDTKYMHSQFSGKNLKHVIEPDRSYVAFEDKDSKDGIGERITPYGKGNPQLKSKVIKDFKVEKDSPQGSFASNSGSQPATPSFSGSTSNYKATSDYYTIGKSGEKIKDNRLDSENMNIDTYFSHADQKGKERPTADRAADFVHNKAESTRKVVDHAKIGVKMSGRNPKDNVDSGKGGWSQQAEKQKKERKRKNEFI